MKRIYCYFFVGLLFSHLFAAESFAQKPFYDAKKLKSLVVSEGDSLTFNPDSLQALANILIKYTNLPNESEIGEIAKKFQKNPYFSRNKRKTVIHIDLSARIATEAKLVADVFETAGGIDVTNFADGLAKFIVKRAKHELGVAFFEQFRDALKAEEDLQKLFPATYRILTTIDEGIFNYKLYLAALRQAFEKDLSGLLDSIPLAVAGRHERYEKEKRDVQDTLVRLEEKRKTVGNSKRFKAELDKDIKKTTARKNQLEKMIPLLEKIKRILAPAVVIAKGLRGGKHPGDILAATELETSLSEFNANVGTTLKVFNLFSSALKSEEKDSYWVDMGSLTDVDDLTLIIFLGLVYQQADDNLEWQRDGEPPYSLRKNVLKPIADKYHTNRAKLTELKQELCDFLYDARRAEDYLREIRKKKISDISYKEFSEYLIVCLDLVERAFNISKIANIVPDEDVIDFVSTVRVAADLGLDLHMKYYSSALFNAVLLMDKILENAELSGDVEYREKLIKYGSFMATIAEAENSDQVYDAIEAVALPPGSASIKRKTKLNLSINSYFGYSWGAEWYNSKKSEIRSAWAPVGIAGSFGSKAGAFSIFASVIDIGAVTTYRIYDDNTSTIPKLELQNIFAPGISIIWGMPWWPLSTGVGVQLGPQLRGIKEGTLETGEATYRWHWFASVDIPIINLYTKPK